MRRLSLLSLVVVLSWPSITFGWGAFGHTMIGQVAAKGLPEAMPMFFRAASDQLAFLNLEPDRWRDTREQTYGPWLNGSIKDHHVLLDLVPSDILGAPDRYTYLDLLAKRGIISPIRNGPVPGLLHLRILELTQQVRIGFRRWRETSDPRERTWIEARIIDDAGVLGHYVADAANPHHTTVHMFGWFGPNPEGYATDEEFHGRFESQYVESHIKLPDVLEKLPPEPRVFRDLKTANLQHLERSHSLVKRLYQLDGQERFSRSTAGTEHKEFTTERLVDAATMLRDLWWSAWVTSGETAPTKP